MAPCPNCIYSPDLIGSDSCIDSRPNERKKPLLSYTQISRRLLISQRLEQAFFARKSLNITIDTGWCDTRSANQPYFMFHRIFACANRLGCLLPSINSATAPHFVCPWSNSTSYCEHIIMDMSGWTKVVVHALTGCIGLGLGSITINWTLTSESLWLAEFCSDPKHSAGASVSFVVPCWGWSAPWFSWSWMPNGLSAECIWHIIVHGSRDQPHQREYALPRSAWRKYTW